MRLHELAKELGVTSKELLQQVREIGLNVKSHSSNLEAGEESILRYAMKEFLDEKRKKEEAKKKKTVSKKGAEAGTGGDGAAQDEERAGETAEPAVATLADEDAVVEPGAAVVETEPAGPEAPAEEIEEAVGAAAASVEGETGEADQSVIEGHTAEAGEKGVADPARPPLKKLKKIARKKSSATILGRIELPTSAIEQHKRSKEKGREKPRERSHEDATAKRGKSIVDIALPPTERQRPGREEREVEEVETEEKVRRAIKPKQAPVEYAELEDDPALQGIRISHWDKHYKQRRPVFRHSRGPKKLRKTPALSAKRLAVEVPITIKELSQQSGIKAQDIIMSLIKKGRMLHINSLLDEDAVLEIAVDFSREFEISQVRDEEEAFLQEVMETGEADGAEAAPRPPIVTMLGHVDHGKTSLLDAIRKTRVVDTEEGGITQHISAYTVRTPSDQMITFLDTPGHRAFTEMRARGANVTDIVVLVVAGDDGVMPQTEEAIQHAKAADVPIVVAINKMDKPDSNPRRVKQQLAGVGIMTEDWGGEVGCVEVSAVTGKGLDDLLGRLVLEAEILELQCNPEKPGAGVVLESRKDVEIGNVVTLLITDGTIRPRDTILAGEAMCRVRGITDDKGKRREEAGPSMPVNVTGFETLPEAGERFMAVDDTDRAREIAELRRDKARERRLAPDRQTITLENLFQSLEAGKVTEIPLVVKADVKGSLEVLRKSFGEMDHEEVKLKIIRDGVGGITEEDILLAVASNAIVIGFRVAADSKARKVVEENNVDVRTYRVIYELLEDLRLAMEGALKPIKREQVTGHLEIRQVFRSSRLGNIAGCFVTDGVVRRNSRVRLVRDGVVGYEGELDSLKRFKEDQREVKEGYECGLKIAGFDDVKVGDTVEAFEIIEEKRTLEQDPDGAETTGSHAAK